MIGVGYGVGLPAGDEECDGTGTDDAGEDSEDEPGVTVTLAGEDGDPGESDGVHGEDGDADGPDCPDHITQPPDRSRRP